MMRAVVELRRGHERYCCCCCIYYTCSGVCRERGTDADARSVHPGTGAQTRGVVDRNKLGESCATSVLLGCGMACYLIQVSLLKGIMSNTQKTVVIWFDFLRGALEASALCWLKIERLLHLLLLLFWRAVHKVQSLCFGGNEPQLTDRDGSGRKYTREHRSSVDLFGDGERIQAWNYASTAANTRHCCLTHLLDGSV